MRVTTAAMPPRARHELDPRIAVCVVFVAALFMSIMDGTIVNVALPTLVRAFGVPTAAIQTVVIAYLVSLAVAIPASGWVGDRWGTKRTFLVALGLFTGASALCGLSVSLAMLIGFRALQGAAGGMLTPVGTAMLFRAFLPAERMQVSRILMVPTVVAPALGPVLGGLLVVHASWRWVFFVNLPLGLGTLIFGLFFLNEHREPAAGRFDPPGFVLAAIGFTSAMYALSEGPSRGWLSSDIVASGVAGIGALAVLVVIELRTPIPLLDLRLLSNRLFRTANIVSLCAGAGFLGLLFLAPLFLQQARGVTALTSGLTTFPEALGVLLSSQIVAHLYPRIGPRRIIAVGLLGVSVAIGLQASVGLATNLWFVRLLMFLTGMGMACAFLPANTAAFATITPAATGRASALFGTQGQLGGALGIAVISGILAAVGTTSPNANGSVHPHLAAYHAAFLGASALALAGALIALTIADRDAAATMQRRTRRPPPANAPAL